MKSKPKPKPIRLTQKQQAFAATLLDDAHRIAATVRKTMSLPSPLQELLPYAEDGMLYAVGHFNPKKKVKFSSFLFTSVKYKVLEGDYIIRFGGRFLANYLSFERRAKQLAEAEGITGEVSDELLARATGRSLESTRILRKDAESIRFATPVNLPTGFKETKEDIYFIDRRESALDRCMLEQAYKKLLSSLSDREREVVVNVVVKEIPPRELAGPMKISNSRIAQIKGGALAKMRSVADQLQIGY